MAETNGIYDYSDYRLFLRARVSARPKQGHGQWLKLAKSLSVHPSLISQVLRGNKDFSPEHACGTADFLGLRELETDYFLALVDLARAGNGKLRTRLQRRLEEVRRQGAKVQHHLPAAKGLRPESQALFYSNWYFSALRLASSLPGTHTAQSLAEHFALPVARVQDVIDFLVREGLCVEKDGAIRMGPDRTHISADSPLVTRHHMNWRMQAINAHPRLTPQELAFTGPFSIAGKHLPEVRKILLAAIAKISALVEQDEPTKLACLNIDLFELE